MLRGNAETRNRPMHSDRAGTRGGRSDRPIRKPPCRTAIRTRPCRLRAIAVEPPPTKNGLQAPRFRGLGRRRVVPGGTKEDKCVARCDDVGYNTLRQPVRGGGAPPTPPPRIDPSRTRGTHAPWP